MVCERLGSAIVCSSRRSQRCKCGKPATLLCDWRAPAKKSGTCDAPICEKCAVSAAPDKDICQRHAPEFEAWKAARAHNSAHNPA